MLVRFAHRGTPAAIEDQIEEAKREPRGRSAFDFHDALFERAQGNHRPATNSQIEKARSPAAGGS